MKYRKHTRIENPAGIFMMDLHYVSTPLSSIDQRQVYLCSTIKKILVNKFIIITLTLVVFILQ